MIKISETRVNLHGLQLEMQPALKHSERIWKAHGYVHVVTSGRDGLLIANELREKLRAISPHYDVIEHSTHIHVEWDALRAGKLFQ